MVAMACRCGDSNPPEDLREQLEAPRVSVIITEPSAMLGAQIEM